MGLYIFIYTLVLLATLCDYNKKIKVDRLHVLWWLVIVVVLFRGLRWRTGTDWLQFEMCFETCSWDNITSYDRYGDGRERMEMGYVFLNWLIKQFGNYTLFLLFTNVFLVGTWAYMAQKMVPRNFLMAFAMILVSNMFFPVRLQLSAGIICWTLYCMINRKWTCMCMTYMIACLFHKSAIILLPIFPLLLVRVSSLVSYMLLFLSLVGETISLMISDSMILGAELLYVYYPDLASNIEVYSNCEIAGARGKSEFSIIISFLFSLFLLWGILKGRKRIENLCDLNYTDKVTLLRQFNLLMNCFLLFTFIYKFFSVESLANLMRLSEFFTCGYALCLVKTCEQMSSVKNRKIVYVVFVCIFVYKLHNLLNTPYPDEFFPYYSVFDTIERRL